MSTLAARASNGGKVGRRGQLGRLTATIVVALLYVLILETILEAWVLAILPGVGAAGDGAAAALRLSRNGLYIVLAFVSVIHVVARHRWRSFLTPADGIFAALVVVLVVAGVVGGSSPSLTLQGVYVYLRAAIVLYAVRAVAPDRTRVRPLLWAAGALLILNVGLAILQAVLGPVAYTGIGYSDLTWASQHRSQGFQSHPNHLGHLLALALVGLSAWFASTPAFPRRWWGLFALFATGLVLTQSRESLLGLGVGIAIITLLRWGALRRMVFAVGLVTALTLVTWTIQPGNWANLAGRVQGVATAVDIPSGSESAHPCDPATTACTSTGKPKREIRVLYLQQGLGLLAARPFLGYGVGQFGGGVASDNNPEWYKNPKFGPGGFNMNGFNARQVDSFWLHLVVETGIAGMAAYLTWLASLGWPLVSPARRRFSPDDEAGSADFDRATAIWGCATIGLLLVVGGFSPAPEDAVFAPLAMGVIGLAWALRRTDRETIG